MKTKKETIPKWMKMPRKEKKAYKKKLNQIFGAPKKRYTFIESIIKLQRRHNRDKIILQHLQQLKKNKLK